MVMGLGKTLKILYQACENPAIHTTHVGSSLRKLSNQLITPLPPFPPPVLVTKDIVITASVAKVTSLGWLPASAPPNPPHAAGNQRELDAQGHQPRSHVGGAALSGAGDRFPAWHRGRPLLVAIVDWHQ